MIEIRFWQAEDGTKFDDEYECIEYERKTSLKHHKDDFIFLDHYKEVIPIEEAKTDNVCYIIVKHRRCAPDIGSWFEADGCLDPFDGIYNKTVEGTWVWGEMIELDDQWVQLESEIEKLQTLIEKLNKGAE